jgi:hypothetical protein
VAAVLCSTQIGITSSGEERVALVRLDRAHHTGYCWIFWETLLTPYLVRLVESQMKFSRTTAAVTCENYARSLLHLRVAVFLKNEALVRVHLVCENRTTAYGRFVLPRAFLFKLSRFETNAMRSRFPSSPQGMRSQSMPRLCYDCTRL